MTKDKKRTTPVTTLRPSRGVERLPAAVRPLMAPINVTAGAMTQELRSGSLLIGRSSECEIVLHDHLVSRVHARLVVTADGVTLEDLHSTNGVYVNGDRIVQMAALNAGDVAMIGSEELTFAEIGTDPVPPPPPPSTPEAAEHPSPSTPRAPAPIDPGAVIPITARAEALDLLGTLARRLANEQKGEQAPRMLGPHLRGILRGAGAGLVVPETLSRLACEYALDLAHWTADPSWLDYVIELHLVTKRLLSAPLLAGLQRAERWVGPMNRSLLEYYVTSFAGQKQLDASEKRRLLLLRRLLKKK